MGEIVNHHEDPEDLKALIDKVVAESTENPRYLRRQIVNAKYDVFRSFFLDYAVHYPSYAEQIAKAIHDMDVVVCDIVGADANVP